MEPTRTLPEGYVQTGSLDLLKNLKLMIWMNVGGLLLLAVTLAMWVWLAVQLRGPEVWGALGFSISAESGLVWIFGLIGVVVAMLLLHEAVHGVFFWLFTGQRPVFGIGLGYAYAAAPGWYLPRLKYLWVGISPLVVISLVGTALMAVVPVAWLPWLILLMAGNASGAVGDLVVAGWLLTQPPTCLAEDRGDSIRLFNRANLLAGEG